MTMILSEAVAILERKASNMRILAAAERGPGARAAGERLRTDAEAIETVLLFLRVTTPGPGELEDKA